MLTPNCEELRCVRPKWPSNAFSRQHSRRLVVEISFQSLFALRVFVELHLITRLRYGRETAYNY